MLTLNGESPAARYSAEVSLSLFARLHGQFGMNEVVENDLEEVFEDCRNENWDGAEAEAVSWDTYNLAKNFLLAFPRGTPIPSIGAEPDGSITAEWASTRYRTLSVSVTPNGELCYAALIDDRTDSGREIFCGFVPARIKQLIREVVT